MKISPPAHKRKSRALALSRIAFTIPRHASSAFASPLGIVAGGFFKGLRAYKRKFEKKLALANLSAHTRRWLTGLCIFGLIARGVVFVIIGGFLMQAGWQSDPEKARGLPGALQALRAETYGSCLFAIVAAGLAAYGIYCGVRAFYGRWGER